MHGGLRMHGFCRTGVVGEVLRLAGAVGVEGLPCWGATPAWGVPLICHMTMARMTILADLDSYHLKSGFHFIAAQVRFAVPISPWYAHAVLTLGCPPRDNDDRHRARFTLQCIMLHAWSLHLQQLRVEVL